MKIRNLIYSVVVAGMALLPISCEKWIDINHNPNNPENVPPKSLFAGAEVTTAYNQMAWDNLFVAGVWEQYFTQYEKASQFKEAEKYFAQNFEYNYRNAYASLGNLKEIIEKSSEESEYRFVSELLSIYNWQNIVDLWGDVPYSEALNVDITSPKFDNAADIYKDLLKRIDQAIADYESGKFASEPISVDGTDFIFDGDLELWCQFAYSLKLKLNIHLAQYSGLGMTYSEMLNFISDESKFLTSTNAMLPAKVWGDKSTKLYPLDEYENGQFLSTNIVASMTYTSYTGLGNDPRAAIIFGANPVGALQGDYQNNSQGNVSKVKQKDVVKNIPLISAWEVLFNMAEIYVENGDMDKAKAAYENAVKASLEYWGVSDNSILTNDKYASWDALATDKEQALRLIGLQRWVAFAMTQHGESFVTRNRTKYPVLSSIIPSNSTRNTLKNEFPAGKFIISFAGAGTFAGAMPASAVYPQSGVLDRNINAPAQKSNVTVKIFWDTKETIVE